MELQDIEESIDLVALPIGVYVYQLFSATGVLQDSGRFIKR